ncbi:MAG: SPASM domain-containing protein, partial [Candidatus Sericytochromatia bacterium]|nr:SPASM domain-containing protein [Candidatus Tanganyikabacteria bacterium]
MQRELAGRRLLEEDLLSGSTEFRSRPYEAHVQFSNICNMSCIMCYDGVHPEPKRIGAAVLRRFAEEVAPQLSVVTPHSGSEPLVAGWDEMLRLVRRQGLRLGLTTNLQFLDERRFRELDGLLESLTVSIDSHIPEVFEKIRPGSRPEMVFANLPVVARLCAETGVELFATIVLLNENCEHVTDTIAALAKAGVPSVNVIQMLDVNGRSEAHDPLTRHSLEYLRALQERCMETARAHSLRLMWRVGPMEWQDFREDQRPDPRKAWNDEWDFRFRRYIPGFCRLALNRLRVEAGGDVAPCGYSTRGELSYGNLAGAPFEELWNGPTARDLRRAMSSGDLPEPCSTCIFAEPPRAEPSLYFVERIDSGLSAVEPSLEVLEPAHGPRLRERPAIRLRRPAGHIRGIETAVSLGGEEDHLERAGVLDWTEVDGEIRFDFPAALWECLSFNLGYWWCVWIHLGQGAVRSKEVRSWIRQRDLPRIEGSKLLYADRGQHSPVDLGAGWFRGKPPAAQSVEDAPPRGDSDSDELQASRERAPLASQGLLDPMNPQTDRPSFDRAAARRTGELMGRARKVLAYGGLDGVIQRPLYYGDSGVFPQFAVEASGCELVDSCGQRYVDWSNGWGPVMLGY